MIAYGPDSKRVRCQRAAPGR